MGIGCARRNDENQPARSDSRSRSCRRGDEGTGRICSPRRRSQVAATPMMSSHTNLGPISHESYETSLFDSYEQGTSLYVQVVRVQLVQCVATSSYNRVAQNTLEPLS